MTSGRYEYGFIALLIGFLCLLVFSGPAPVSAQTDQLSKHLSKTGMVAAPMNPDFVAYNAENLTSGGAAAQVKTTAEGYALGYMPPPMKLPPARGDKKAASRTAALPAKFDLRTSIPVGVTAIRDQGQCGSCWTFGAMASLESHFLYKKRLRTDFSEGDLNETHGFDYGVCMGGNWWMSTAYMARWGGPVNEVDAPYPYWFKEVTEEASQAEGKGAGASAGTPGAPVAYKVQNVYFITQSTNPPSESDIATVKAAIMENGAVTIEFHYRGSSYNSSTNSYYCSALESTNHIVAVVGWDDNFPSSNFKDVPPGNGAFIVKNSWGTEWGEKGYFYMSYYDRSLNMGAQYYDAKPATTYTRIYQHDPLGWVQSLGYYSSDLTTAWFANLFMASSNASIIKAVSVYTPVADSTYELDLYSDVDPATGPVSGTMVAAITGTIANPGYNTVVLAQPVKVTANKPFSVVMRLTTPDYNYPIPVESKLKGYSSAASACPGQSYTSPDGVTWEDSGGLYNVNLKAFAVKYWFN